MKQTILTAVDAARAACFEHSYKSYSDYHVRDLLQDDREAQDSFTLLLHESVTMFMKSDLNRRDDAIKFAASLGNTWLSGFRAGARAYAVRKLR